MTTEKDKGHGRNQKMDKRTGKTLGTSQTPNSGWDLTIYNGKVKKIKVCIRIQHLE